MIRRDDQNHWLLISQLEHARVAAELAEAWHDDELAEFAHRGELLSAIRRHDDGWAAWELAPTINDSGQPRDFTEMSMAVATAIWTRCIEACTSRSVFGGLWVSRHFCHLAERARDSRGSTGDQDAINLFLSTQASLQDRWRERLIGPAGEVSSAEERGYLWLQTFDRISLWLCCADRDENRLLALPSGNEVTFHPSHDRHVAVDPFPFAEPVTLSVESVKVPRTAFQDDEHLGIGQAPRHTIEWRLTPLGVR